MSRKSVFWIVSSSTAKIRAVRLPSLLLLRRPKYWPGSAVESTSVEAEMKKAMPGLLRKDRTAPVPFVSERNGRGDGWKAWPFIGIVPLVSKRRPFDVTAAPSSVRFAPVKPL
ncbi:hypothetical protein VPH35_026713 [Triticum aestivum]